MMKTEQNGSRYGGFTIVELLVVIVIIAILVAIAVPMVNSGIQSAKKANCLSNLKQIGTGLELYLGDNNQIMPELEAGRTSRQDDLPVLETVLEEYLDSEEVFHCPADTHHFESSGSSYLWNVTQNGLHATRLNFFGEETNSKIPLVFDKEALHGDGAEGVNYLYADQTAENDPRFITAP